MVEEWRDIPGFGGRYQVSSFGNVRSVAGSDRGIGRPRTGKNLKFGNLKGYRSVCLRKDTGMAKNCTVHRLVALAFLPPGEGQIRHLDGNKLNNHATNLAWGTAKENASDRDSHGTTQRGTKHYKALRTEAEVRAMRALAAMGLGSTEIGLRFGISKSRVHEIVSRRTWKHIP